MVLLGQKHRWKRAEVDRQCEFREKNQYNLVDLLKINGKCWNIKRPRVKKKEKKKNHMYTHTIK